MPSHGSRCVSGTSLGICFVVVKCASIPPTATLLHTTSHHATSPHAILLHAMLFHAKSFYAWTLDVALHRATSIHSASVQATSHIAALLHATSVHEASLMNLVSLVLALRPSDLVTNLCVTYFVPVWCVAPFRSSLCGFLVSFYALRNTIWAAPLLFSLHDHLAGNIVLASRSWECPLLAVR